MLATIALLMVESLTATERRQRSFRPLVATASAAPDPVVSTRSGDVRVSGSKERLKRLIQAGTITPVLSEEELDILIHIESSGRNGVIGDTKYTPDERAYGVLQIRQCYVTDVNRKFGTNLRSTDCQYDIELSKLVVQAYMNIYGEPGFGFQEYARMHNGGPSGHLSTSTDDYWKKVIREKMSR